VQDHNHDENALYFVKACIMIITEYYLAFFIVILVLLSFILILPVFSVHKGFKYLTDLIFSLLNNYTCT
jgi:hypothetical protein